MKLKFLKVVSGITLITLSFTAFAQIPEGSPESPPEEAPGGAVSTDELESREEPVNEEALEAAIAEVGDRVQMSAPMAIEIDAGVDPVLEAVSLGLIVEATLEQVEAALAAAAATPDPEDDLRALELKHRGSYRFFCDAPPAESDPSTAPAPGE